MNCWFTQSVTDSFGISRLAPLHDGLGLLPGSCCPHYDGWAADDGAALVFYGETLSEVVASRPEAAGYRVIKTTDSQVSEQRIPARYLGNGAITPAVRLTLLGAAGDL
jgi:dipeptidase E